MTVDYDAARELFLATLEQAPDDRDAFLRSQCEDNSVLLAEVRSLLEFHEEEADDGSVLAPLQVGDRYADRYRILWRIGRGGMGDVYHAHDEVLDESVALKRLAGQGKSLKEALLNEVRLARRVTHPRICRVYDLGEWRGEHFITMEFVDGEDLGKLMRRVGRLPSERVTEMAHELCVGLAAAHAKGVLHRDLKPANILVDADGHIHITDFGIAAPVGGQGTSALTGTPSYMAPEQLVPGGSSTERSDIYSLGLVLHEMLTGKPVYRGVGLAGVLASRRDKVPGPPSELVADVGPELERAVLQSLRPDPRERPASALELAGLLPGGDAEALPASTPARAAAFAPRFRNIALTITAIALLVALGVWVFAKGASIVAPQADQGGAESPRLAVLSFNNLGSAEDDYFADGITEEITSRIARISGLRVMSRQSANQYKSSDKTLQQIGEELGVEYVLEGTIRTDRAPDGSGQVRVTPQLIRVSDDAHLWTNPYTANLVPGEIFGVQEQIAEQVAEALDVTLPEPERQRLAGQPTDNPEAYDYFLRGIYYHRAPGAQDSRIARIEMYQQAVDSDPDFALAYAYLSIEHSAMWWYFQDRTPERLAMAKEAVDEALRLDPDLPAAHRALGWYHYWGQLEYDRALAEFAIAQQGQPNSADLRCGIAAVQRRQGNMVEALANYRRCSELDPRSADAAYNLAQTYALLRNPVEAARHFDRAISSSPDGPFPYAAKARWVHLRLEGSTERARSVLEEAQRVGLAEHPAIASTWARLHTLDGNYQEALDRLALVSSEVPYEDQFFHEPKAQLYAQIHGLMGNRQLERAYYDSTRSMLESKIQQDPDDERLRSALGIAYAGLGRKEDAIREGELAIELLPMSKDAFRGAYRAEDLARIYAMVGEYDAAIDQLGRLLALPSITAVPMLRIDPAWEPLRDRPRFQALLARYEN